MHACKRQILLMQIELLRNKMTEIACDKGFTSEESIIVSQELDRLLNIYNNLNVNNSQTVNSYKYN